MPSRILWLFLPIVIVLAPPNAARSADRHAGYYYPPITSEETFRARSPIMENASREVRIGYIVAQTNGQHGRGFPPRYAMFAKGDDAEKRSSSGWISIVSRPCCGPAECWRN